MSDDHTNTSKYFSLSDINNLNLKKGHLSAFHVNAASLNYYFDNIDALLSNCNIYFDFIGISETKLKINCQTNNNANLPGYTYHDCKTESSKGGVRLYISSKHNCKHRQDLEIYKSKELECVFIGVIINNNRKNLIVGCIYRHTCMPINEYNESYLNSCLKKASQEKKDVVLLGDLNIELRFPRRHWTMIPMETLMIF